MAAKRNVPWQGPAKLWAVGKREYKVEYRGGGEVIVLNLRKRDPEKAIETIESYMKNLRLSIKKAYLEGMDIDKKLEDVFNTLSFLSDEAKTAIAKIARDDAKGNFSTKMSALRQSKTRSMRKARAERTPEQIEADRAKNAEQQRRSRERAKSKPASSVEFH